MLVQIGWLILVAGAGVSVARRYPVLAATMSSGIARGLLALWLIVSVLGFWVEKQQGPEIELTVTETTMRHLHTTSGHVVVIAAWLAFVWTVAVSAVRSIGNRALWRMALQFSTAFAVAALVLFSSSTGYLNRPDDPDSYLRFRVLHTIAAPVLGTSALLVFCAVMERARRAVRDAHAKIGP